MTYEEHPLHAQIIQHLQYAIHQPEKIPESLQDLNNKYEKTTHKRSMEYVHAVDQMQEDKLNSQREEKNNEIRNEEQRKADNIRVFRQKLLEECQKHGLI